MKKIVKILVGLVFMLGLVACSNTDSKNEDGVSVIKKRGELIVGMFSDVPPFGYVNQNGQYDGFDVFISKQIAKDLLGDETKVKFVSIEAASRVEFLKSNKVDIIMANFTKTPERAEMVDFATPYMKVALGVASKDGAIKKMEDLVGKKLIVVQGTTADVFFSKNAPGVEIIKFQQATQAFNALKTGRGDAIGHDNVFLFAWANENGGYKVGIDSIGNLDVIAPAVKKGNTKLLEWLNKEIDTLISNGFINKAYDATLEPVYGKDVDPKSIIF